MEECICPVLVVADTAVPAVEAEVPVAAVIVEVPVVDTADVPAAWVIDPAAQAIWAAWDISLPLPVPEEVGVWAVEIPTVVAAAAA